MSLADPAQGLFTARAQIADAAAAAGRRADDIALMAVSKTFPAPAIAPLIAQGQTLFGENRVQEAQGKWPGLRALHKGISLHLIGPLQTNKAAQAVALFDCIASVDRPKLAAALAREVQKQGKAVDIFIQVNTGEEPQKAGVTPAQADALIADCRRIYGFEPLGLMCLPPVTEEPALHFSLLAKIARRNGLTGLNMGMSRDFATAIACGATHIRLGSAIFGPRRPRAV